MKMNDVFELPVYSHKKHEGCLFDNQCKIVTYFSSGLGVSKDECDAAAHAINRHDKLVEALTEALEILCAINDDPEVDNKRSHYSLLDLARIGEALSPEKGE